MVFTISGFPLISVLAQHSFTGWLFVFQRVFLQERISGDAIVNWIDSPFNSAVRFLRTLPSVQEHATILWLGSTADGANSYVGLDGSILPIVWMFSSHTFLVTPLFCIFHCWYEVILSLFLLVPFFFLSFSLYSCLLMVGPWWIRVGCSGFLCSLLNLSLLSIYRANRARLDICVTMGLVHTSFGEELEELISLRFHLC